MSSVNRQSRRANASDLERVIEPLASYICATEAPRAALSQAFTVLLNEVAQLNRAAKLQVAAFAQSSKK